MNRPIALTGNPTGGVPFRRRTLVTRMGLLSDRPYPALAACAACAVVLLLTMAPLMRAAQDPGFQPSDAALPLSFEENRGQPAIKYSTYFGNVGDDRARAVATDSTGATYFAGSTTTGGVSWGFVSKVNPAGTAVVYNVVFGTGVCDAAATSIAVDSLKNAIVTGFYVQQDQAGACTMKRVFGAKLNPAGTAWVYQRAWGGSQDSGNAVAVDGAGNAYFTGSTNGDFPTTPGVISPSGWFTKDAFITKLSPTGAVIYSTYLGGSLSDEGLAIAVDT